MAQKRWGKGIKGGYIDRAAKIHVAGAQAAERGEGIDHHFLGEGAGRPMD